MRRDELNTRMNTPARRRSHSQSSRTSRVSVVPLINLERTLDNDSVLNHTASEQQSAQQEFADQDLQTPVGSDPSDDLESQKRQSAKGPGEAVKQPEGPPKDPDLV